MLVSFPDSYTQCTFVKINVSEENSTYAFRLYILQTEIWRFYRKIKFSGSETFFYNFKFKNAFIYILATENTLLTNTLGKHATQKWACNICHCYCYKVCRKVT